MDKTKPNPSEDAGKSAAVPADSMHLDYQVTLRMGDDVPIVWAGQHLMPHALDPVLLCNTQINFPSLIEMLVQKPFVIYVCEFLQQKRDVLRKLAAEKQKQETAAQPMDFAPTVEGKEMADLARNLAAPLAAEPEYPKLPVLPDWLTRPIGAPDPRERPKSYIANPSKEDAKKAARKAA